MGDPVGFSEEKGSELRPVQAVVLGRFLDRENEGVVLIQRDGYFTYIGPRNAELDITEAGHLAKAAKARAQESYKRRWDIEGEPVVYDYNPTDKPLGDLEPGLNVALTKRRRALGSNIALRGRQDPDTHELVNTFFVLVDVFEKQRAEARAAQPATAQSDEDLFASICNSVDSLVADCSYTLPPVLRLSDEHPFASAVNKRFIPRYPRDLDKPYVLMEGLAPMLPDPENPGSLVRVEPIRLIDANEKDSIRRRMTGHPVVLLGVSGSGKTQLICEMLAERYGLLFVAHRGGNGGCPDFEDAVKELEKELKVKEIGQGLITPEQEKILERNLETASRTFQAVVLARLVLLRALKRKFGGEMSPGLWLWVQLYPDFILQTAPDLVIKFRLLWGDCRKLSPVFITEQCRQLSGEIVDAGGSSMLPCFVDEAQTLLQKLQDGFLSTSDKRYRRSLFSALVKSLDGVCIGPLMAGTGIRMADATKEIATAIAQKPGVTENDVQFPRRGHLEPENCRAYILRYLGDERRQVPGVEPDDLTAICQTLQGRPRFTAMFVSNCLEKGAGRGVMDTFNEYVNIQVKGEPLPQGLGREKWSNISIYWALERLHERLGARRLDHPTSGQGDVMMEFLSVTLRYAITGQPQTLTNPQHFELIENGMANIDYQDNGTIVSIREPIVVRAASYFFGLLESEKFRMAGLVGNLSALGNEFEAYIALALCNSKPLSLSEHAPINVDGVAIPGAFSGEWKLWYPAEAIQTGVLGCDSKQDDDLVEFLGPNPHHVFLFPDVYAGSDVLSRLHEVNDPGRHLRASLQMKFREEVADPAPAIASTDLQAMFRRSDGTDIKTRNEVRERALKAVEEAGLPLLRILVAYPAEVEEPAVQVVSDSEVVLIIDGRNAAVVFDQKELQLLTRLYNMSRNRRAQQPQATPSNAGESSPQSRKRAAAAPSDAPSISTRRSVRQRRPVERLDL